MDDERNNGYHFAWDAAKAESNERNQDVRFEEARSVFRDPLAPHLEDESHSSEETRGVLIEMSDRNRLLFVSFTLRQDIIRIISARPTYCSSATYYTPWGLDVNEFIGSWYSHPAALPAIIGDSYMTIHGVYRSGHQTEFTAFMGGSTVATRGRALVYPALIQMHARGDIQIRIGRTARRDDQSGHANAPQESRHRSLIHTRRPLDHYVDINNWNCVGKVFTVAYVGRGSWLSALL